MVEWTIKITNTAQKDAERLKSIHLDKKAKSILEAVKKDPFGNPPPFEKLRANFKGKYSRRINIKHRFVYGVDAESRTIVVYAMFKHYGD